MLQIDKFSGIPIYEQVVKQIEFHILMGNFPPGEPLPSVRSLAIELSVNPNTLQKAYTELEHAGICKSVPGSGRFVCDNAKGVLMNKSKEKLKLFKTLARELYIAGITRDELLSSLESAILNGGNAGKAFKV